MQTDVMEFTLLVVVMIVYLGALAFLNNKRVEDE
jgi:hypothetical protein